MKYLRVEPWCGYVYGQYGEVNGIRAERRFGITRDFFSWEGRMSGSAQDTIAMVQAFGRDDAGTSFCVWSALGRHGTTKTWKDAKARADAVLRRKGLIK